MSSFDTSTLRRVALIVLTFTVLLLIMVDIITSSVPVIITSTISSSVETTSITEHSQHSEDSQMTPPPEPNPKPQSPRRHSNNPKHGNVGNPVCNILFPPSLQFLKHHKTGTVLARTMYGIIRQYCGIQDHSSYLEWLQYVNFRNIAIKNDTISQSVRFHFSRDPVLTIISGFNYHMTSPETWTHREYSIQLFKAIASFFNDPPDFNATYYAYREMVIPYDVDREIPNWKDKYDRSKLNAITKLEKDTRKINPHKFLESLDAESRRLVPTLASTSKAQQIRAKYLYYLNEVVNTIDLKEYGDFYGFDLNFDDTEIHRKYNIFRGNESERVQKFKDYPSMNVWYLKMFRSEETMQYGLFYEMMRYLFGTFSEIYDFHQMITDPECELKMEVWISDFDRNLNVILDRLNLIDSKENRAVLKQEGLSDIDIAVEREALYQRLKSQDASNSEEKKGNSRRLNGTKLLSRHIHKERDNSIYIDALLGLDPQICLVLKHITNLIEYGWLYPDHC